MKHNPILVSTYRFRPLKPMRDMLRYASGEWIPDDGQDDLAFIGRDRGCPIFLYVRMPYRSNIMWSYTANWRGQEPKHKTTDGNPWHYMLSHGSLFMTNDSWPRDAHLNEIASNSASNKCCKLYSCANGSGPEFHLNDPYIKAGLLKTSLGVIVKPPNPFICCMCGPINLEETDKS